VTTNEERHVFGGWLAALLSLVAIVGSLTTGGPAGSEDSALARLVIVGDAIPESIDGKSGDATRGRMIVLDREVGNCLICHEVPERDELFQGELGPNLAGIASRLNEGQIRLRLVDQSRLNPRTLMPPYYRVDGLQRVAAKFQGKPLLTAQELEDVVAYLLTLKD
jgi:L-cysteine S-thiosulfotransferase